MINESCTIINTVKPISYEPILLLLTGGVIGLIVGITMMKYVVEAKK